MQMKSQSSEYFLSLQCLLRNFLNFMHSLNQYTSFNPAASHKLKNLTRIWNHPKGISNLIKNIALKANYQQLDFDSLQPEQQMVKEEFCQPKTTIEVKNPLLPLKQPIIKQEQEEEMMDYSERSRLRSRKDIDESYSQSMRSSNQRCYKRGPYKSYSTLEKQKAVQLLIDQELPITEISRMLKIPCKNIKRWSTEGVCRKRGGGRKRLSPTMENEVRNWIRREFTFGEVVEVERVQEFALAVNTEQGFKASRGWVLKFIERYNLKNFYLFK